MDKYIELSKSVAYSIRDVTFLRYFIPVLLLMGPSILFYYGYKGVFKKETILLGRLRGYGVMQSGGTLTGISAVIMGIIYILIGLLCLYTLGGLSWFLLTS